MRFPWVRRTEYERLDAECLKHNMRANHAEQDLASSKELVASMRRSLERNMDESSSKLAACEKACFMEVARADAAETRAKDAMAQAIAAIQESRQAINEAVGMAKIAAASMFGTDVGDVEPAPSVGQADRMAAIRLREEQQSARR